jgi:ABC-type Fe3+-siderophore transport system permease subunit
MKSSFAHTVTVKLIILEMKMMTWLNRFNSTYFFSVPPETQIIWLWLGAFIVYLVATFGIYLNFRTKAKKAKPFKKYAKGFFWPNLTLALIGLLLTFSRYEKLALLSWRFWVYFTVLLVIVFNVWHFIIKRSKFEDELLKFHNNERKSRWLDKKKK